MPTSYTITFSDVRAPEEGTNTFKCGDDNTLSDAASSAGFDWPVNARGGSAGTSMATVARLLSGNIEQRDPFALSADEIRHRLILTDVAYPTSDCLVEIGADDEP